MKVWKRVLPVVLAGIMAVTIIPAGALTAYAEESQFEIRNEQGRTDFQLDAGSGLLNGTVTSTASHDLDKYSSVNKSTSQFSSEELDQAVQSEGAGGENYVPGEVIVVFSDGILSDGSSSIQKSRTLQQVGPGYGLTLQASGSEEEAAEDAESEVEVLKDILGSSFTIEDSLVFSNSESSDTSSENGVQTYSVEDDELSIALVSSDTYSTEEMISMLSESDAIASAEPNAYIHPVESAEYSLNDPYNQYLYQLNSPTTQNTGGQSVSDRGTKADTALSVNVSSAWGKLTGDEDEAVVAVIDTGVLDTHEDLKNRMWTNPGDIGLEGEHGYNFYENTEDSAHDDIGHGTHCAGVIAAQADNGIGTAGMAGNANVKIMALKIMGNEESSTVYTALGAFSYVLKAKQAGVNVVATNNSWSADSQESTAFDHVIDMLGEAGILTYISAGNASSNTDREASVPVSSESDYAVIVGAADITGKPAPFSNWGKSTVDFYAPGVNILSTVGYDSYLPSIYSSEELAETTEYYGEFSKDTVITDNAVTPDKGQRAGDSVKQFGESVFRKQSLMSGMDSAEPDKAKVELSIDDSDRYFSADHPERLKLTIKDAQPDEEYYFYFPYEKNPETNGDADTKFSIVYESTAGDEGGEALISAGEVSEVDGRLEFTGDGVLGYGVGQTLDQIMSHCTNYLANEPGSDGSEDPDAAGVDTDRIMSYEEAEGRQVGIGLKIMKHFNTDPWGEGESHDFTVYIDSIGVSKPDNDASDGYLIDRKTSYEIMSGTSMASPAAAGAGALLAYMTPKNDSESDSEYALRVKDMLLSNITETDALKDLCSTGGYLDLTHISEAKPMISDAVCDVENGTVTLQGDNLLGCTVSYRRLAQEDAAEIQLPSGGMETTFSEDGKSIVITNAKELFGTYTEFTVKDGNGKEAIGSYFVVNGMNKFTKVAEKLGLTDEGNNTYFKYLVTDKQGKNLYGYDIATGTIAKFNGKSFVDIDGTNIDSAFMDWLEKSGMYDRYHLYNGASTGVGFTKEQGPVSEDGKIYQVVYIDIDGETRHFFAVLDLDADEPGWKFSEFDYDSKLKDVYGYISEIHVALDGKIYFIGTAFNEFKTDTSCPFLSYDIASNTWETLPDLPYDARQPGVYAANGKIYYMFGHDVTKTYETPGESLSDAVYCYDVAGKEWTRKDDLAFIGKYMIIDTIAVHFEQAAKAANGLIFVNTSVDGLGNCFLYNTESDSCEPLNFTVGKTLSDTTEFQSCVATRDGIYYIKEHKDEDEFKMGYELYLLPVDQCPYKSIYAALNKSSASLKGEQTLTLKVISGKAVSWKSSNTKVCTVKGGKVTALKKGSAVITATLMSGQKVKCKITVTTTPKLSKSSASLKAGKTLTLKVSSGKAVSWKSSNTKVCTVKGGKVTALKKGSAVITATLESGQKVTCKVKVTTSPSLSAKSITVSKGKTKAITITGKASSVNNAYSNTSIAKVISKKTVSTIKVKGLKKGSTTLKIKVNGVTLKLKVTVK